MMLFIFKYCLPALLGYTLFVGISGRLNPLYKPFYANERPSWVLGIWTGLSVCLVLSIGLHMAYGMSLEGARSLIKPSAWFMAGLILPGFLTYFAYRHHLNKSSVSKGFDWTVDPDDIDFSTEEDIGHDYLDQSLDMATLDAMQIPEPETDVVAAFLDTVDLTVIDSELLPQATNDASKTADTHTSADLETADTHTSADLETADTHSVGANQDGTTEQTPTQTPMGAVLANTESPSTNDTIRTESSTKYVSQTGFQPIESPIEAEMVDRAAEDHEQLAARVSELNIQLVDEQAQREEVEKHLRITRKALSTLEAESRDYESRKADAVISLEEKLAISIEHQSESETAARRSKDLLLKAEASVANLKQDLVKAKQDIRRSTAARAKALSTANKTIAFARQAVQIRAQLESEIEEARITLKNRQATNSSLIRALEKEKRRTQDEVTAMAKQLALHDKQKKVRRSLEDVARNVENKLTSRLVKKVAKARPLTSDQ